MMNFGRTEFHDDGLERGVCYLKLFRRSWTRRATSSSRFEKSCSHPICSTDIASSPSPNFLALGLFWSCSWSLILNWRSVSISDINDVMLGWLNGEPRSESFDASTSAIISRWKLCANNWTMQSVIFFWLPDRISLTDSDVLPCSCLTMWKQAKTLSSCESSPTSFTDLKVPLRRRRNTSNRVPSWTLVVKFMKGSIDTVSRCEFIHCSSNCVCVIICGGERVDIDNGMVNFGIKIADVGFGMVEIEIDIASEGVECRLWASNVWVFF